MIIGLTGTMGSGKGKVVDYLVEEKGFWHFSVSGHLEKLLENEQEISNRESLTKGASELRRKNGNAAYLVKSLYNEIKKDVKESNGRTIIESIRNPAEVDFLKSYKVPEPFCFIAIDAPLKTRYDRVLGRGTYKDQISWEQFKRQHEKEMDSGDSFGLKVKECIKKADYVIENESSSENLFSQVEEALNDSYKKLNSNI